MTKQEFMNEYERNRRKTLSYAQRYGSSAPLCGPNKFAVEESKKNLDRDTAKCYTQFPSYKFNNLIKL